MSVARRKKTSRKPRDPRICQIVLDNNALRRTDEIRSSLVDEFHRLAESLKLSVIKPHGVEAELQRAPKRARDDMEGIYTISVGLNEEEDANRSRLRAIMRGNAQSSKHDADADHLFEASKYGGGYFITHDSRIRRRADEIASAVPGVSVVTLCEFVDICREISQ